MAGFYAQDKRAELQRTASLISVGVGAFAVPAAIAAVIWGQTILGWFGPEFTDAKNAFDILVVGQLVNALAGPVGYLLTMTGHQTQAARILGACAAANLVLNALLIPSFGGTGAAVATSVSMIAWNVSMAWVVRRELDIYPSLFGWFKAR
jgi:O-antigen/teichoic acid export membrane protein